MASRRIYGAGLLLVGAAVAYASVASGEKKEDVPAVITKASGFFPATVNGFTMTVGEYLAALTSHTHYLRMHASFRIALDFPFH
jgi:hypothetical protein